MTDKKQQVNDARRRFLRSTSIAGAGALVAGSLPAIASEPTQVEKKKEEGYRLTKHIQDYYKSASS